MKESEVRIKIKQNGKKNIGLYSDRLKFDEQGRETAFSEHWTKENISAAYRYGILQDLFIHSTQPLAPLRDERTCLIKIQNRDRLIVATIIQWLGSNVGWCWLNEAVNKAGYKIVKIKE
jgi:hypothetical protein